MILFSVNSTFLKRNILNRDQIGVTDLLGFNFSIKDSIVEAINYEEYGSNFPIKIGDLIVDISFDGDSISSVNSIKNTVLDLNDFSWLEGHKKIVLNILHAAYFTGLLNQQYLVINTHRVRDKKNKILVIDFLNKQYREIQPPVTKPTNIIGEKFFCCGDVGLIKLSNSLKVIWSINMPENYWSPRQIYNHDRARPILFKSFIIHNFSSKQILRSKTTSYLNENGLITEQEEQDYYSSDGRVVCLDIGTGASIWEANFDYQVDDILLVQEDKVLVTSERNLFLVNIENGSIEKQWNSQLRDSNERVLTGSNQLLALGDQVFHFSYKDCRFQVLDANSLEVIRSVDCVEQGLQFGADRPHVFGDKIFVPVDLRDDPFSGGSILMIDSNNIDGPIEIEQGPDFKITEPSPDKPGIIECEVDYEDWGNMFRFAERTLLSKVMHHSSDDKIQNFTPRKIKLRYSGYKDSRELVQEKMEVFKKRFERSVEEPQLHAISVPAVEVELELV